MYEYTYVVHPFGSKVARAVSTQWSISLEVLACATSLRHLCFDPLHILLSSMLHFLFLLGLRLHALVFQQFLGKRKAWVRQADVLLTKHQQAKSLWPHTQADVMLTNHREPSPCGHKHRTKVLKEKTGQWNWAETVTHNSTQRDNYLVNTFKWSLTSSFLGSKAAQEVSTKWNTVLETLDMCYFFKTLRCDSLHILLSSMLHFLFLLGLRLHALVFQQFLGICHIIALRVACSSREWQRGQV